MKKIFLLSLLAFQTTCFTAKAGEKCEICIEEDSLGFFKERNNNNYNTASGTSVTRAVFASVLGALTIYEKYHSWHAARSASIQPLPITNSEQPQAAQLNCPICLVGTLFFIENLFNSVLKAATSRSLLSPQAAELQKDSRSCPSDDWSIAFSKSNYDELSYQLHKASILTMTNAALSVGAWVAIFAYGDDKKAPSVKSELTAKEIFLTSLLFVIKFLLDRGEMGTYEKISDVLENGPISNCTTTP